MLNPLNLFILLGFLAQGLIWDSYPVLLCLFSLWFIALRFLRNRVSIPIPLEGALLLLGCGISVLISFALEQSWHFFLGDGLILLQLARLTRPLNHREKLTSLVIAVFHFTVLCTLLPNIRFVLLYVAALFLFPGALKEVNAWRALGKEKLELPEGFRLIPSARVCFWMLLGSAFVFLSFPRFTGTPMQLRESLGEQGSLLDSILDPRKGGRANSQQVLLQIEGDALRYLRCAVLTEFDGIKWSADSKARLYKLRVLPERQVQSPRYKKRVVYVKSSQYLGHLLPVDGKVAWISGNFFTWPLISEHGVLSVESMWTTGNNVYTNYIDFSAPPRPLSKALRRHLTEHPPQSAELRKFVHDRTASTTNPLLKARLLENYLRNNFTYELGSPELSRLSPVDDFVFRRRSGHCERFAAALALMLRMEGIPSRIAIGYVATSRNLFNGRAQVRFSDAHSWTEGYIDGAGWVTFDATPGPASDSHGSDFSDLLDALDFAWYSHVVNFNGFAQHDLINTSRQLLARIPTPIWNTTASLFLLLIIILCAARFGLMPAIRLRNPSGPRAEPSARAAAQNRYERMLQALEDRGYKRSPEQTPHEFQRLLRDQAATSEAEAGKITASFCSTFYGERPLSAREENELDTALEELERKEPK
jgi:hypothetical protein